MPHPKVRTVACPNCGTLLEWNAQNPHRPFCSERCKLIDFGQWATGAYAIPQEEADDGTGGAAAPPEER